MMKPEFKLGCHTCSAQLRGKKERNSLCWALLNHSSVLVTMAPFKPLAKLPNKPPFVTWVSSKKNKFKKKACIRLLLKNLSAPISLTRLHSQRARQLAWYAFNSLGTSAGLGSNEKKKKSNKTNIPTKIYMKR